MEKHLQKQKTKSLPYPIEEVNVLTWKVHDRNGHIWICERGVDISEDLAGQDCWQV